MPTIPNTQSAARESGPTKVGVCAALNSLGFWQHEGPFPPSLISIVSAASFTPAELSFAEYLVADTDFGGAWNDAEQIEMHCPSAATTVTRP